MATTLPQAVDALRTAVEDLTHSIATQGDDGSGRWLVGVTVVLVAVTACYAWQTHRLVRETRTATEQTARLEQERRSEERRMIAGVLGAELRVCGDLLPILRSSPFDKAISWRFDSSRTSFFDSAGTWLFLLGPELLQKTVECYSLVHRVQAAVGSAQRAVEEWRRMYVPSGGARDNAKKIAEELHDSALSLADEAIGAIEALIPKLREVAQTEELLRS